MTQVAYVVYVATVSTRYEIMAVGTTEREAIDVACGRAMEWLRQNGGLWGDVNTLKRIEEYFGVCAQRVEVGTAVIVGCE